MATKKGKTKVSKKKATPATRRGSASRPKKAGAAPSKRSSSKSARAKPSGAKKRQAKGKGARAGKVARRGSARTPAAAAKPAKKIGATAARAPRPAAKTAAKTVAKTVAETTRPPIRRHDRPGHLDPQYAADLRSQSGFQDPEPRAFFERPRADDDLAEERGEDVVEKATSGEDDTEEQLDQIVPEEQGGPFVETTAAQEFAHDIDESNPKGAKREPFPTT